MNERIAVSELVLQGAGDRFQRLRQQSTNWHRRSVKRAAMEGDTRALHPVTCENVREWASVVVTRDGPKHLWSSEWKLSRECGTDLAAWFLCAKATRWGGVERVLLFAWLSGIEATAAALDTGDESSTEHFALPGRANLASDAGQRAQLHLRLKSLGVLR